MRIGELPARVHVHGLSGRKVKILRRFLPATKVLEMASPASLPADATVILWGGTARPDGCPDNARIIRLEDGFLRSVGLGADLIKPVSWVFDDSGIYFDATRPSNLEQIFAETVFSDELLNRACTLRKAIVAGNLTKYNVGNRSWQRPVGTQKILLVPGQVETDASIRLGAPGINTNMGLLQAVRTANPLAYIVYKPHPDVLAGLRIKGRNEDQALQWCDEQVTDVAMGELLQQMDEVHTLTSLAGFEALLRGKMVTCYGQPFYAGWGLTTDLLPLPRRNRSMTLDELVAGALILYPTYISRTGFTEITPEQALAELLAWREQAGLELPLWRRLFRIIIRSVVGVR